MALSNKISWKYAGVKVIEHHPHDLSQDINVQGVGKTQAIELQDGNRYHVSCGYYVPFYPPHDHGEAQFIDRERIIGELKERFFRAADPKINQRYNREQIEWLKQTYQSLPEIKKSYDEVTDIYNTEKRTAGAILVGAIINRIDRLAIALIEKRRTGEIPDTLGIESATNVDELESEIKEYIYTLTKNAKLVNCVKRNTNYPTNHDQLSLDSSLEDDTDGILFEMITEVAKALSFRLDERQLQADEPMPEPTESESNKLSMMNKVIDLGRVLKIGGAMRCIDEICDTIDTLVIKDPVLSATPLGSLIKEMGITAKNLVGIKKSEVKNYTYAMMAYDSLQHDLDMYCHNEFGKQPSSDAIITLVKQGFHLIKDMTNTRLPCNEVYWIDSDLPANVPERNPKENNVVDERTRMAKFEREVVRTQEIIKSINSGQKQPGKIVIASNSQPAIGPSEPSKVRSV